MSGLDLSALQDAITAEVERLLPNHDIYEDSVPEDVNLPRDASQKVKPFIVIRFAPMGPNAADRAMAGPRHDGYLSSFDLLSVSMNGPISRKLNSALVSQMIGFKPDGISPVFMRSDGGAPSQFTISQNEVRPTLYVVTTRLRFNVNNSNIGAPVPIPTP